MHRLEINHRASETVFNSLSFSSKMSRIFSTMSNSKSRDLKSFDFPAIFPNVQMA